MATKGGRNDSQGVALFDTIVVVFLAYVDESYTSDWYYMAALLCDGGGAQVITSKLDTVVSDAVRDSAITGDPTKVELHGYELFHGKGSWANVEPRRRIGIYNSAFEVIGEHCEAVILRGMDTAGQRRRYSIPEPPHKVVLLHLLERIHDYIFSLDDHVLVIADEVGEQASHRSDVVRYRSAGTWGYRARKIDRVVDTLHFAPSSASRLLQAIDLIVFLYRRRKAHAERHDKVRRANDRLWRHIESKIVHQDSWLPLWSNPQMHEGPIPSDRA